MILGALTIGLGALLVWGGRSVYLKLRGRRPDFVLTHRGDAMWELERTGRKLALAVVMTEGFSASSNFDAFHAIGNPIGDIKPGQQVRVTLTDPAGAYVWFSWIAGGSRYYSKSLRLEPAAKQVEYVGIPIKTGGAYET